MKPVKRSVPNFSVSLRTQKQRAKRLGSFVVENNKKSLKNSGKITHPITIVDPRNRKLTILMLEDTER